MNPSALQSIFQAVHPGKGGVYDQAAKLKKKQPMMLHSDPSILGTVFVLFYFSLGVCLGTYHFVW